MKKLLSLFNRITHYASSIMVVLLAFSLQSLTLNSVLAKELEEIVVTATRYPQPIREISASVTVIDSQEIDETGKVTVLEVLRGLPGVDVVQSGGPGAITSVFLRGANSDHTLVLIDGVKVNSPTTGMFDFANLAVDNIKRIEIVRGPQSTLYGSTAIGGVINIITKKGVKPFRMGISTEAGSFRTFRVSSSLSGATERFDYSLSVSRFNTDGISRARVGVEDDAHENTSFSARLGFSLLEDAKLNFVLRHTDSSADLDGFVADDLDRAKDTKETVFSASFDQPITERWNHKLSFSVSDALLEIKDPGIISAIDTRISALNWQHKFDAGAVGSFIAGIEWEEQKGISKGGSPLIKRFDKSITNWGYYLQYQWNWKERLFLTPGVRLDDHETFGSDINYQIGIAYLFSDLPLRLRGNLGTGFKAPTFNDLFWPATLWDAGNPDLLPEESVGYDLGIDLYAERFHIGATYFHNDIKNLIAWAEVRPWFWTPSNIGKAETKGIELEASFLPFENLRVTANYTYTDAKDKITGRELPRRPRDKYRVSVNYRPIKTISINPSLIYVGGRWDDARNTRKLKSYTLVDLTAFYDLSKNIQISLRGENIFNEGYEEAFGFGVPPASIFGGVRVSF